MSPKYIAAFDRTGSNLMINTHFLHMFFSDDFLHIITTMYLL